MASPSHCAQLASPDREWDPRSPQTTSQHYRVVSAAAPESSKPCVLLGWRGLLLWGGSVYHTGSRMVPGQTGNLCSVQFAGWCWQWTFDTERQRDRSPRHLPALLRTGEDFRIRVSQCARGTWLYVTSLVRHVRRPHLTQSGTADQTPQNACSGKTPVSDTPFQLLAHLRRGPGWSFVKFAVGHFYTVFGYTTSIRSLGHSWCVSKLEATGTGLRAVLKVYVRAPVHSGLPR